MHHCLTQKRHVSGLFPLLPLSQEKFSVSKLNITGLHENHQYLIKKSSSEEQVDSKESMMLGDETAHVTVSSIRRRTSRRHCYSEVAGVWFPHANRVMTLGSVSMVVLLAVTCFMSVRLLFRASSDLLNWADKSNRQGSLVRETQFLFAFF